MEDEMSAHPVGIGPTGRLVAANLKATREARNLPQRDLSALLANLGHPRLASAISKIESGQRVAGGAVAAAGGSAGSDDAGAGTGTHGRGATVGRGSTRVHVGGLAARLMGAGLARDDPMRQRQPVPDRGRVGAVAADLAAGG